MTQPVALHLIEGKATLPPNLNSLQLREGSWNPYIPHSFGLLTECSCVYLSRFSTHGKAIREAFEEAIISMVDVMAWQDRVVIASIGSGGLFQEAVCIARLVDHLWDKTETQFVLHLVDRDYKGGEKSISYFADFVASIYPKGRNLPVHVWNSCEALAAAIKVDEGLRPHLIVGMDTEKATHVALKYQWKLLPQGDLDKALIVRWVPKKSYSFAFQISSRKGSGQITTQEFSRANQAATYIKNAGIVP